MEGSCFASTQETCISRVGARARVRRGGARRGAARLLASRLRAACLPDRSASTCVLHALAHLDVRGELNRALAAHMIRVLPRHIQCVLV